MKNIIDFSKSLDNVNDVKIFLGDHDGIQRYDRFKYSISDRLVKVQQGSIWFPKEISYAKDMVGILNIPPEHEEIYRNNLLFQTKADSLANRFLDNCLSSYVTSPEMERVLKWQSLFEIIHSEAYSENIRKVYPDAEKFFNDGFKNEEIRKRLDLELKSYNALEEIMEKGSEEEKKLALIEVCLRQYALENLRFFVSFLYTFQLNEINEQVLQGSVNNISLILNDEIIHTTIFKHLLNILRTNHSEGFVEYFDEDMDKFAIEIFSEVIESEIEWFRYQSSIAEFPNFTEQQIREFLGFYANRALELIKIGGEPFVSDRNSLVEFFEAKKDISNKKALAQETEQLSYNIGVLDDEGFFTDSLLYMFKDYFDGIN